MNVGKKIRLGAGKACQYIIKEDNIEKQKALKRFFIKKSDSSLEMWRIDEKIHKSDLRIDKALNGGRKFNIWDDAKNELKIVVINMGKSDHEFELYGL